MTDRTPMQRALDAEAKVADLARENERLREALAEAEGARVREWTERRKTLSSLNVVKAAKDSRIAELEEALRFYAGEHPNPNDGPWGVDSDDYGNVAIAALSARKEK